MTAEINEKCEALGSKGTYVECTSLDSLCRLLEVATRFDLSRDGVLFVTKVYASKETRLAAVFS